MDAASDLVWPNAESAANSDPWLITNHDRIRLMQPRVLVVNFVHGLAEPEARRKLGALCAALRESSRWHGYREPEAPAFLDYRIVEIVDLTEPRGTRDRNSARFPRAADGIGFDYAALHDMPLHDGLRLEELTERGLVNEVWLLADHTDHSAPWETVEVVVEAPVGHEVDVATVRHVVLELVLAPAHPVTQGRG